MKPQPNYLIAIFGPLSGPNKTRVSSGWYPPEPLRGFWPYEKAEPGDFLLLYCTDGYPTLKKAAAGVDVVISAARDDGLRYRYLPLKEPPKLSDFRRLLDAEAEKKFKFLRPYWLFKISEKSFWSIVGISRLERPQQGTQ